MCPCNNDSLLVEVTTGLDYCHRLFRLFLPPNLVRASITMCYLSQPAPYCSLPLQTDPEWYLLGINVPTYELIGKRIPKLNSYYIELLFQ